MDWANIAIKVKKAGIEIPFLEENRKPSYTKNLPGDSNYKAVLLINLSSIAPVQYDPEQSLVSALRKVIHRTT